MNMKLEEIRRNGGFSVISTIFAEITVFRALLLVNIEEVVPLIFSSLF
jgi:hypothetical protein